MPPRRPRMVWALCDAESSGHIAMLHNTLSDALQARAVPFELPADAHPAKPFAAHITLARCGSMREAMQESPLHIAFPAEGVLLMESHMRRRAPVYTPLAHFPFHAY